MAMIVLNNRAAASAALGSETRVMLGEQPAALTSRLPAATPLVVTLASPMSKSYCGTALKDRVDRRTVKPSRPASPDSVLGERLFFDRVVF